ncbi:AAA family ATPase [Pseudovibrio sp. POLY-S9]|uniref:AAA family ATPase n=1 Tax=Pseudovibrio sp. POLY-S9 TaxID=1576596 RepID=UPI00070D925B|nr:AAA family ATPase [Pseudovibrio sp. POLY-S9]
MSDNYITALHLRNFKGFQDLRIDNLNKEINILIGDNDAGKSSVLLAIDLVLNAFPNRVETIGLERLLNQTAVKEFLDKKDRKYSELPEMEVDLYLNEQNRH